MAQLEKQLDARLFHRTTRQVRLTEAGSAYYARAVPLVAELEDMDSAVGGGEAEPRGALRIAAPTSFGTLHLGPALCDLQKRHPKLTIELVLNDRAVNPVNEGFDVAFANRRHRIDLKALTGKTMLVYGQNELQKDAARDVLRGLDGARDVQIDLTKV